MCSSWRLYSLSGGPPRPPVNVDHRGSIQRAYDIVPHLPLFHCVAVGLWQDTEQHILDITLLRRDDVTITFPHGHPRGKVPEEHRQTTSKSLQDLARMSCPPIGTCRRYLTTAAHQRRKPLSE